MTMTATREVSLSTEIIDVRDIIDRFEYLEDEYDAACHVGNAFFTNPEASEAKKLKAILDDLQGNGGDEQWRGDWYPLILIRDSYFNDYAEELADDIGAIDKNATWPMNCIDWDQAARELQIDYSSIEIEGLTYWYR